LSLSPTSFSLAENQTKTITVTASTSSLIANYYSTTVNVTSNGEDESGTVEVTMFEEDPILSICSGEISHNFGEFKEGENPSPNGYQFTVCNTGGGTLSGSISESASWLNVSPTSFSLPAKQEMVITVTASTSSSSLSEGDYSTTVNVTSNGGNESGTVIVKIIGVPKLSISPNPFEFNLGEVTFPEGVNEKSIEELFTITNSGSGTLEGGIQINEELDDGSLVIAVVEPDNNFTLAKNVSKDFKIKLTIKRPDENPIPKYQLRIETNSNDISKSGILKIDKITDVKSIEVPITFSLTQNYPNPFNPSTTIRYAIPENSPVQLKVYDVLGVEVSILVNETQNAGYYNVSFNAANLSNGIYFYKIQAGNFLDVKKMILLK